MTLRWKKEDKPTGLSAVGANPNRGSYLHDGTKTYAWISPVGGGWSSGPLKGSWLSLNLVGNTNPARIDFKSLGSL